MSRKKKDSEYSMSSLQEEFKPLTKNQADYVRAMAENTITFVIGPAGSSKSYSALALACQHILSGKVDRIIIARPTIEASPRGIGFLKGDLNEKMAPWVLPAIEHLKRFLGGDVYYRLFHEGKIEFAPLEYMRGRTFLNAFCILEEAQNCTTEQIKMFVSRIGIGSRMVINGDIDQTDLRRNNDMCDLEYVISKIDQHQPEDVCVFELGEADIVRHPIIGGFLKIFK